MEGAEAAAGLGGEEGDSMAGVDTKANAVCVINAQGIIQMANKVRLPLRLRLNTLEPVLAPLYCVQPLEGYITQCKLMLLQ
jgi:hypothetical protein